MVWTAPASGVECAIVWSLSKRSQWQEPSTLKTTTIGLDLAKSVFQAHGVDDAGTVTVRKKLRRSEVLAFFRDLPACLIGMEACATAHHWARELAALGHEIRLMPPNYVKPYVRRQKNDAADAEAICEAVTRPTMRFVPVKSVERQGVLTLHRTRELLVRQRTMLINAIRSHCAEFGLIGPQGARQVTKLIDQIRSAGDDVLPELARSMLLMLADQLLLLADRIHQLERQLLAWHRQDQVSQRLATIPGSGSSAPRPCRQASAIRPCSDPVGNSPPSWAWSPDRTPREARIGWAHLQDGR